MAFIKGDNIAVDRVIETPSAYTEFPESMHYTDYGFFIPVDHLSYGYWLSVITGDYTTYLSSKNKFTSYFLLIRPEGIIKGKILLQEFRVSEIRELIPYSSKLSISSGITANVVTETAVNAVEENNFVNMLKERLPQFNNLEFYSLSDILEKLKDKELKPLPKAILIDDIRN